MPSQINKTNIQQTPLVSIRVWVEVEVKPLLGERLAVGVGAVRPDPQELGSFTNSLCNPE